ncbi:MAG: T9SS type A sorting domain-containing protein [Bacteroidetes bacterium]|nr:T9SS type A sorting domain-containing protein [Bacteroidota bacterium]HET6244902.1 T9SS type A sorting domain-containing protein [Bacteroidia bacterium]
MKYTIFLAFTIICNFSFGQYWEWAKELEFNEYSYSMDVDDEGNIFIQPYTNNKDAELFKFSTQGEELWKKKLDGIGGDFSICPNGNLYMTTNKNDGKEWILSKIDNNGEVKWNKTFSGQKLIRMSKAHVDKDLNIWITGHAHEGASFENHSFSKDGLYILKISTDGNLLQVYQSGMGGTGWSISTDSSGHVYIMGGCVGEFVEPEGDRYGELSLGNGFKLECPGYYGIYFMAEFNADLEPVWLYDFGTPFRAPFGLPVVTKDGTIFIPSGFGLYRFSKERKLEYLSGINCIGGLKDVSIDKDGNLNAIGQGLDYSLTPVYLGLKFNQEGDILDTYYITGNHYVDGYRIRADGNNNLYFYGSFYQKATFGPFTFSNDKKGIFIAKANQYYPYAAYVSDTLESCNEIQFSSQSLNYTSLHWEFEGGLPASSTEANQKVYFSEEGRKKVLLIAENQNTRDTSMVFIEVCETEDAGLAVKEILSGGFAIFPNPAKGIVTIKTNITSEPISIELFDISGRKVMERKHQRGSNIKIDISHLGKGIYFLNVKCGNEVWREKLVVE